MSVDDRRYPARPIVGVGGVVVSDRRVLLVQRARPPLEGRWSLPGGLVEPGESLCAAVEREVREETGLLVRVGNLVDVVERIVRDPEGRVEYHYVLLDYRCTPVGGSLEAGSDAGAVAWATLEELEPRYRIAGTTRRVIQRALAMADP